MATYQSTKELFLKMLIPRFHLAEIGVSSTRRGEGDRQLFLLRARPVILKGSQAEPQMRLKAYH